MRRWILLLGVTVAACVGEVDDHPDDSFGDMDVEDGPMEEAIKGLLPMLQASDCRSCASGDCGHCIHEGELAFQCWSDPAPRDDLRCYQTGSVYHGERGPYFCYRCDG
jgi:hypothetical protein